MKVGSREVTDSGVSEKIDFKKKIMQQVSIKAPTSQQPCHPQGHSGYNNFFSGPRQILTRSSLRAYSGYSSRRDTILMVWKMQWEEHEAADYTVSELRKQRRQG